MDNTAPERADAPQSFLTKAQQAALDAALLSKEKAARAVPSIHFFRVGPGVDGSAKLN